MTQGQPPHYDQGPQQGHGAPAPSPKKRGPRLWLWALVALPAACIGIGVLGAADAGKKAGAEHYKNEGKDLGFSPEQLRAAKAAAEAQERAATAQRLATEATQRQAAEQAAAAASAAAEAAKPASVKIQTLLGEYKDNELRADGQFKDRLIRVTGKVDEVKKDMFGAPFVTLGTGQMFETPQVQCVLAKGNEQSAASLSKGSTVTVTGRVGGLLMMSVMLGDCRIE